VAAGAHHCYSAQSLLCACVLRCTMTPAVHHANLERSHAHIALRLRHRPARWGRRLLAAGLDAGARRARHLGLQVARPVSAAFRALTLAAALAPAAGRTAACRRRSRWTACWCRCSRASSTPRACSTTTPGGQHGACVRVRAWVAGWLGGWVGGHMVHAIMPRV
jgi:hypothetical protein